MAVPGMSGESWRRDPRSGWLALALLAAAAFVAVVMLAMLWPAFDSLDAALSAAVRSLRAPALTTVALGMTTMGSTLVIAPLTVVLMIWMAARRNWAGVIYVFMTVAVGWFFGNDIVKYIVRRPRPVGVSIGTPLTDFSMPSGHSLAAFLFFATMCVVVMLNLPTGRHMKRWLAAVSAIIILGVGFSRVYLGVHWVGDVVAAYLLGGAWWSFTSATYFGSVTEERRVTPRPGEAESDESESSESA